jgi:hypothetical protein
MLYAGQSVRIFACREDFGLRWQSAAATSLSGCERACQSGVALRFPHSKTASYFPAVH